MRSLISRHLALSGILLLALINGLLYVFLVPPWQHYDEPSQFEYAWLIANRQRLPQPGDFDAQMRRETMRSMAAAGFYRDLGGAPDIDTLRDDELNLVLPQLDDPAGYYLIAAVPLFLMRQTRIVTQMYAARLVSFVFFLASIAVAYLATTVVTPPHSPLRWITPLTIALLPAYADVMTAVNNDAGANLAFTVFLLFAVVPLRRGLSWPRFAALALAAVACWVTKRTAAIAIVLVPLVVLLSLLNGTRRRRAWIWISLAVIGAAGVVTLLDWGDAAYWYRGTQQLAPTRASVRQATTGLTRDAFRLDADPVSNATPGVLQLLPQEDAQALAGRDVTLGAWMWATQPFTANLPMLSAGDGSQVLSKQAFIGDAPSFHAFTATLPAAPARMWVTLRPFDAPQPLAASVYYSGVILVEGNREIAAAPRFDDASAVRGQWDVPFVNYIRNASAQQSWPFMRPWWTALRPFSQTREFAPFNLWSSILDPIGAGWYFELAIDNILKTFWAVFGWGQVQMPNPFYDVLAVFSAVGLVGLIAGVVRRRRSIDWTITAFLMITVGAVLTLTLTRGIHSLLYNVFIPGARYAYVAIWPIMLALVVGWREAGALVATALARALHRSPHLSTQQARGHIAATALLLGFGLLNIASLYRIATFYANR